MLRFWPWFCFSAAPWAILSPPSPAARAIGSGPGSPPAGSAPAAAPAADSATRRGAPPTRATRGGHPPSGPQGEPSADPQSPGRGAGTDAERKETVAVKLLQTKQSCIFSLNLREFNKETDDQHQTETQRHFFLSFPSATNRILQRCMQATVAETLRNRRSWPRIYLCFSFVPHFLAARTRTRTLMHDDASLITTASSYLSCQNLFGSKNSNGGPEFPQRSNNGNESKLLKYTVVFALSEHFFLLQIRSPCSCPSWLCCRWWTPPPPPPPPRSTSGASRSAPTACRATSTSSPPAAAEEVDYASTECTTTGRARTG